MIPTQAPVSTNAPSGKHMAEKITRTGTAAIAAYKEMWLSKPKSPQTDKA